MASSVRGVYSFDCLGRYRLAVHHLSEHPLSKPAALPRTMGWSERYFSGKTKTPTDTNEVDIIKGERLRTFSVADELIKWAKLKEDGHITEQEFNDARKKLLQRWSKWRTYWTSFGTFCYQLHAQLDGAKRGWGSIYQWSIGWVLWDSHELLKFYLSKLGMVWSSHVFPRHTT